MNDRIVAMPGMTRACVRVFQAVCDAAGWLTIADVAADTNLVPNTIRWQVRRLHALGVLEVVALWPGHRIRMAEKPDKDAIQDLNRAAAIYGGECRRVDAEQNSGPRPGRASGGR